MLRDDFSERINRVIRGFAVCIFMCNFLTYTATINQNFGVLLIRTFKRTTSFKLSLPGHFVRLKFFTEVLMKVQFCGV